MKSFATHLDAKTNSIAEVRTRHSPSSFEIIHLLPSAQLGGAERAAYEMISAQTIGWPHRSLKVIVPGHGPMVDKLARLGVEVIVRPFPNRVSLLGDSQLNGLGSYLRILWDVLISSPKLLRYVLDIRRVVSRNPNCVLHAHGLKMQTLASIVKCRKQALVWHCHDFVSGRPIISKILYLLKIRFDYLIANSESTLRDWTFTLSLANNCAHVPYIIDLSRFTPEGPTLDLITEPSIELGSSTAGIPIVRFGLVATFARWKGHMTFLQAVARIPPEHSFRAFIIGDRLYSGDRNQYSRAELLNTIEKLGLVSKVTLVGFLEKPEEAIRSLDFVVHASDRPEPFGLVIVESLACGKPVIAADEGGAGEFVDDGHVVGYEPRDPASLSRRIVQMLESRDNCRLSARVEYAKQFGDPSRFLARVESIYLEAIKSVNSA